MRIGVDAHVLSGKFQGSRSYLLNLYREVLRLDKRNGYVLFGHWEGKAPFGGTVKHVDFKSGSRVKRLTYQTGPLVKRYGIDLYHSTFISPLFLPCRSLVSVLDILFETHPRFFDLRQRYRNRLLVRRSVELAEQVHTISEYCRRWIIDVYGLPENKVKVVPCGIDLTRFNTSAREASTRLVLEKLDVSGYILTVGRLEPRKNHAGLVKAYAALKKRMGKVPPLVIVGQKDFGYRAFFEALAAHNLEKEVVILENLNDELLPDLYRAARIFVYPSFAEGFGIPPLEAMASGIPVVSSNITAMAEVVGECGLLINPESCEELAEAMHRLLTDPDLYVRLSRAGTERAGTWSWENAAKCYVEAIKEIKA